MHSLPTSWARANGGSGTWWLATNRIGCVPTSSLHRVLWLNCTPRSPTGLQLLTDRRPVLAAATELTEIPKTQIPLAGEWTVGAALIHAYEELAQHLGHLEVTADLLLANR